MPRHATSTSFRSDMVRAKWRDESFRAKMIQAKKAMWASRTPEERHAIGMKVGATQRGKPRASWGEHRATQHAQIHPTPQDIAWAAGFIEGEGYCTRGTRNSIRLAAPQNTTECLERLIELFEGNIYRGRQDATRRRGINSRDTFHWIVFGARARGVMMTIYKFMSQRRKAQIRETLGLANV